MTDISEIRKRINHQIQHLHKVVNNRRDYPNTGDLKREMRSVRDCLEDLMHELEPTPLA